jgi:hypothetical protein
LKDTDVHGTMDIYEIGYESVDWAVLSAGRTSVAESSGSIRRNLVHKVFSTLACVRLYFLHTILPSVNSDGLE